MKYCGDILNLIFSDNTVGSQLKTQIHWTIANTLTFDIGMVEKTGTGYRIDGYRIDGYRIDGYRIDGYRIDGYRIDGYRIDGYRYTRNLELIRKTAIFSTCLGA